MALGTIDDVYYGWTSRCVMIFSGACAFTTLGFHVYKIKQNLIKRNIPVTKSIFYSIVLHIIALAQICIFGIWDSFVSVHDEIVCHTVILGYTTCYSLVKWTLYMVLSYRIGKRFYTCIVCVS